MEATAKILPKLTKVVTEIVEVVPKRIVLTISSEQAHAMVNVFAAVAGHPERTARGKIDEVYRALTAAGIQYEYGKTTGCIICK